MSLRAFLFGLLFVLIWSSAFTSGKFIVADAPPLTALALRFYLSGALALAIGLATGEKLRLGRAQVIAVIIFGVCQNALYLGLNFLAFQTVDASVTVVIASLLPISVAIASKVFLGQRLPLLGIAGLALGVIGASIVLTGRLQNGADPIGILLCIGGVLALTLATLVVPKLNASGSIMMMVGLQMLVGAIVLTPFGLATETLQVNLTTGLVVAFAYTTLFPGIVATWLWFKLLEDIGAIKAATFHFLNPFFGVLVAALLLGERVAPIEFVGVGFIMVAILAVQMSRITNPVSPRTPSR